MRSKNQNHDRNEFLEKTLRRVQAEKVTKIQLKENGSVSVADLQAFLGKNYAVEGSVAVDGKIETKIAVKQS